eukprot:m.64244 g.64244  ORF g.64244 m.64244 type:complete len:175 (+) comp13996_c0_seq11:36-560(+)
MSALLPFRYQVYLAALQGNLHWLQDLLQGLEPEVSRSAVEAFKDDARQGFAALHAAVFYNHVAVLEFLLKERNANVDVRDFALNTPLIWAASKGHVEAMQLLLECGADIQACSENGGTALHWACFHGGQASISVLVKAGIDVNAQNIVVCLCGNVIGALQFYTTLDRQRIQPYM